MIPRRSYGARKRTRKDMLAGARSLLLNARDLDRITPDILVRCHGVASVADAERMLAEEMRRRGE